jgi:hypothetical protein
MGDVCSMINKNKLIDFYRVFYTGLDRLGDLYEGRKLIIIERTNGAQGIHSIRNKKYIDIITKMLLESRIDVTVIPNVSVENKEDLEEKINKALRESRIETDIKDIKKPIIIYADDIVSFLEKYDLTPASILNGSVRKKALSDDQDYHWLMKVAELFDDYERIMKANNQSNIYYLGLYVPSNIKRSITLFQPQQLDVVPPMILEYNSHAEIFCGDHKANVTYINNEFLSKYNNHLGFGYKLSNKGEEMLAYNILSTILDRELDEKCYSEAFTAIQYKKE